MSDKKKNFNFANLTFNSGKTLTETAVDIECGEENTVLKVTHSVLEKVYLPAGVLTYMTTICNHSYKVFHNIKITNDLGTLEGVTPLGYDNSSALYVNGVYSGAAVASSGNGAITFTVESLAPEDTVLLVYTVKVNTFAPLEKGSTINNTVTVSARGCLTATASAESAVGEFADISVFKAASTIAGSGTTYTFTLYNRGNTIADKAVLTDTFDPIPDITSVTVNGANVPVSGYTYVGGILKLPSTGGLEVPAASFNRSPSGEVYAVPGKSTVVLKGKI